MEIGEEVKKSKEKTPQQPMQTDENIEKYGLSVLLKCFSPFTILVIFSGKPESLAGLLSAKVSPCWLMFHYHVGNHFLLTVKSHFHVKQLQVVVMSFTFVLSNMMMLKSSPAYGWACIF